MTKYIVVVGGVISGVGKGVATASIGKILQEYGFSVSAIKIDPYINYDAGTLRPTEQGEVWVTDDGGEIDQDLGTYERFLSQPISKFNNITTGQIYKTIIDKERRGDFLGKTVQFIPHIPDEIKRRIKEASKNANGDFDIMLVEIGGTVGDYENIPFLFALKSLEREIGKENIIYILVTYMPIPSHIEEMKTKPTQIAVKLLNENGIQPDFILCRGKRALDEARKKKIELYANIKSEDVISMPDVIGKETVNTIYIVPLDLEKEKLGEKILKKLNLEKKRTPDWTAWQDAIDKILNPKTEINIAIVGKYVDIGDYRLEDSYISINEALKHAGVKNNARINIEMVDAKQLEKSENETDLNAFEKLKEKLKKFQGIIVPGGFGSTAVEGKINAIKYARENNIPFLGLCFGMQLAIVEFARNICKLDANSSEIDDNAKDKVIDILAEQKNISEKGGTMRLGAYKAILKEGSKTREIYNNEEIWERHRHRYEVNPNYHKIIEENGMIFSGISQDKKLVEFIELPKHKFFIATQAHPEFKSSLLKPAPLFDGFVKACLS